MPSLRSGLPVEGDQAGILAANLDDQEIALDQRRGGDSPHRKLDLILLVQVLAPEQVAGGRLEAVQMAHCAKGVSAAVADGDGRSRTVRIAQAGVVALVGVGPEMPAGFPVEAVD